MHKVDSGLIKHLIKSEWSRILVIDYYVSDKQLEVRLKGNPDKIYPYCDVPQEVFDLMIDHDVNHPKKLDDYFDDQVRAFHSCSTNS
jgi:hypothetical protein